MSNEWEAVPQSRCRNPEIVVLFWTAPTVAISGDPRPDVTHFKVGEQNYVVRKSFSPVLDRSGGICGPPGSQEQLSSGSEAHRQYLALKMSLVQSSDGVVGGEVYRDVGINEDPVGHPSLPMVEGANRSRASEVPEDLVWVTIVRQPTS